MREIEKQETEIRQRMRARRRLVASLAASAAEEHSRPQRVVHRAAGKWRGSTLFGYLHRGDDQTFYEHFRMKRSTFNLLVELIDGNGALGSRSGLDGCRMWRAQQFLDNATLDFRVAACLYHLGQGGRMKITADVASVGSSTLRRWMDLFCTATISSVKPIYMPATPPDALRLQAVRDQFASRRGIPNVAMACDGSHIPFRPDRMACEYRNYKGWNSLLCVAFVDSYHCFVDADVGAPGRSGDNTVLAHSWLLQQIKADPVKWLGGRGALRACRGTPERQSTTTPLAWGAL